MEDHDHTAHTFRDGLIYALQLAIKAAVDADGFSLDTLTGMSDQLKRLKAPKWLSDRDLMAASAHIAEEGEIEGFGGLPDVRDMINHVAEKCEERSHLHDRPFQIDWHTMIRKSSGKVTAAKAGPLAPKAADLWRGKGKRPLFHMEICLPLWLLYSPTQRYRLLHHEMGHCGLTQDDAGRPKPYLVPHDLEEFADTLGRFGPDSRSTLEVALATMGHPDTRPLARLHQMDSLIGTQQPLWEAWAFSADAPGAGVAVDALQAFAQEMQADGITVSVSVDGSEFKTLPTS